MPPGFTRPETVLKRAEELIAIGQSQAALQALHEIFSQRRFKQTPLPSLQPIMIRFIDLCVELRRGRIAKDGLMQYKNMAQNTDPTSVEHVIKHFIQLSDAKVVEAQGRADAAVAEIDVDDLEEGDTPENMLLGSVSQEQSKDRTDRALVTPWLKFLWEAYRTALEILRNNARLEIQYQSIATQALNFCLRYQRKTEFRRLCDLLRNHLSNVARFAHHTHSINLADPDTLQRHLDTRFAQLNAAVELELWQEAFRSVEDIHNLLNMAKKGPKPQMMANYYEKLARIFLVSDNSLFHAAAWNRYYALARNSIKSEEEQARMASLVLLSALAVPVISSSAPGTGNMNRSKSDFLHGDQETRSRTGRLTSLLNLSRTPTRSGLLKEALNRNILKRVKPELRNLYNILEAEFHPLSICAKIEPIIAQIAQDEEMAKYVKPLHSVILTRLFQQLSQVYDAVNLDKVMNLVSAFKAPYNYTAADIEKFCLNACKKGHLDIRIDHTTKSITFRDDVFAADVHPSAAVSTDTDLVKLQATPSELVRTQLTRLASALDHTAFIIDPTLREKAEEARQAAFAKAVAAAAEEHKAAVVRRAILARRKEAIEEVAAKRERDEAAARAERARIAAEAEQRRVAEEAKRREAERVKKELEAVRVEEARKLAQSLKEKGGLKLSEEEYANLDTEKLVQLQVEQLEKEKKDLNERLRVVFRRMDHLERAYRKEEIPLIEKDYERQQEEDLKAHEVARVALIEASKQKHAEDMNNKGRLQRILGDYHETRKVIEAKRKVDFEARRERAKANIEREKEKRKADVLRQREEERQRIEREREEAEERARQEELRREQEELEAEAARIEAEKTAELEEKKRAEFEARQADWDRVANLQRQREAEAEERQRQRLAASVGGAASSAAPPVRAAGDDSPGPWRRGGAAASSTADATPLRSSGGYRPGAGGLLPRSRPLEDGAGAGSSPAANGASAAAGASPSLGGSYRPGMLRANREAREREAGTGGASAGASPAKAPDAGRSASSATPAAGGASLPPSSGGAYRPGMFGANRKAAAGESSPASASPARGAAEGGDKAAVDDDGFQTVKRSAGAYRPPGARR
ncbi:eukaryotic translation initiation factor 3 subunit A [Tilletia horrida]|uniref:Eukaryotic translation initiation factor 3 subunit A n=1 Tax=Tilletia horrida TaxID=155126 RepID=A0AAN6GRB6_9BASI|nr:eukaryotic translation initiation factor 3 subunit A [Tilletia horrida]KAK0568980.1 eukaryotic translation initiation factor 3 subunit A [Tilletia horrida]